MRAVVLHQPGQAENLKIEERPIPQPSENEVLIRVRAFGLNRSELMTRKGLSPSVKFPRVLGIECVGEVEEDPSGHYPKGQKVMALMGEMGRAYDGSYAEYTAVPKHIVHPFESTLTWKTLGAIPEMFQTVHGSLHLALGIQPGETLLIRGCTSSIGMLATQMAKNLGLTVIATTRNPKKERLLLENGVSQVVIDNGVIAPKVRKLFPNGVDKVLELVGASVLKDSLQCVGQGGTACMTGMLSESWSLKDFSPMEFIPATVKLTVYDSGQVRSPATAFQEFIHDVETGKVKLGIGKVFRLEEIVQAHQLMESNSANGKIVVLT
ncbi:zinc-binding alcohol dehydrogenase family protein [Maribacter arenosus]|uniref:Zinc-binding dehydrogenase n=1 Tax=Maribacter arenosus TaxID=1854708 RepID=A0ABR7VEP8_9FLAO|nr:zinc-binding alcohol dehydrogenase family protein [Maribacter arenosus]MBD0851838.1 zinc-binding dehydrogenase [Maribacter arenosus]